MNAGRYIFLFPQYREPRRVIVQMENHILTTITLSSSGFKLKSMVIYGLAFCSDIAEFALERLKESVIEQNLSLNVHTRALFSTALLYIIFSIW